MTRRNAIIRVHGNVFSREVGVQTRNSALRNFRQRVPQLEGQEEAFYLKARVCLVRRLSDLLVDFLHRQWLRLVASTLWVVGNRS
jgi:hypothetical protein